jgi:hypothetical protein
MSSFAALFITMSLLDRMNGVCRKGEMMKWLDGEQLTFTT